MFVRGKVIQALEGKADQFRGYELTRSDQLDAGRIALREVAKWSRAELESRLAPHDAPGALPTAEQDHHNEPISHFLPRWSNQQEARAWAKETMEGRPTFAVDGSQIPPQRSISIPVAMVQIGWFENRHLAGGSFEKDVALEILPPDAIRDIEGATSEGIGDLAVNLRRYVLETERVARYVQEHAGDPVNPVVFFDGSLVPSFASRLPDNVRERYVSATLRMIATSHAAGVPLIGYVDTSYAHDQVNMLEHAMSTDFAGRLSDAGLLAPLMKWGDRSTAHICARDESGILDAYQDPVSGIDFSRQVAFTYLKTTADNPPARVEFPLWVLEQGRLEDMLNIVRAETIIGNGYPYALETADAVAVLTLEDRERFYRVFWQFAERLELRLRFSRKARSKQQRRA